MLSPTLDTGVRVAPPAAATGARSAMAASLEYAVRVLAGDELSGDDDEDEFDFTEIRFDA